MSAVAPSSIRARYAEGVEAFYAEHGASYRNPHEDDVAAVLAELHAAGELPAGRVLDLACGSGEVTVALAGLGYDDLDAADPYCAQAYFSRTGRTCWNWTFDDVAGGAAGVGSYDLIVCSYALHLAEPSKLAAVAVAVALASPAVLIISPNTRPELRSSWGLDVARTARHGRARAVLYRSSLRA